MELLELEDYSIFSRGEAVVVVTNRGEGAGRNLTIELPAQFWGKELTNVLDYTVSTCMQSYLNLFYLNRV